MTHPCGLAFWILPVSFRLEPNREPIENLAAEMSIVYPGARGQDIFKVTAHRDYVDTHNLEAVQVKLGNTYGPLVRCTSSGLILTSSVMNSCSPMNESYEAGFELLPDSECFWINEIRMVVLGRARKARYPRNATQETLEGEAAFGRTLSVRSSPEAAQRASHSGGG
ncbi:hypothetical protein C8J57DRAFT_1477219 [Mycena rebaudengoi]|nr:hypothetical protein C8J57DRAFT_1477219 [Mycena rebaudengoi]